LLLEHTAKPVIAEEDATPALRSVASHRRTALLAEDVAVRGLTVLVGIGSEPFP
jgi:hypothetical protein